MYEVQFGVGVSQVVIRSKFRAKKVMVRISPQEVKMHFSFAVAGDKRRGRRFAAAVSLLQPGGGPPAAVKVKRMVV